MSSNFIKKAIKHKGSLHRSLGIPKGKKIPSSLLRKIQRAHAGDYITNPTSTGKKRIHVTRLMERKAILATTLKGLKKRR